MKELALLVNPEYATIGDDRRRRFSLLAAFPATRLEHLWHADINDHSLGLTGGIGC